MAEREQKLRKLHNLRVANPQVSKSCLESLLKYVEHAGLPEKKSAKDMRDANRSLLAGANAYGPLLVHQDLVCLDGSSCKVQFVNLLSFIHYSYKQGGSFYNAFKTLLDEHDSMLGLCLYSDELCPGNPLAASTNRKCWAIYAGFKEMGPLLSNEFAWITICILRSTVVAGLEANMSQVMKKVLFTIFQNPWGEVEHAGILLQPPEQHAGEEHRRVKLYLSFFVQDGQAQKMTWSVKGDSGSRFCSLCSNCFSHMTDEDGVGAGCDFTCHAQLVQHPSEEMFASWDRMQVRYNTCNAGEWKRWQQATGITYSPEALMACPELRHLLDPVTQWMHDYMHCLLSNGLMAYAIFNLLEALSCWQSFHDYTKFWKMPKQFSGINICQVFDKKRFGRVKKFFLL